MQFGIDNLGKVNTNFLGGCIESDHPGAPRGRGGQDSDQSPPS